MKWRVVEYLNTEGRTVYFPQYYIMWSWTCPRTHRFVNVEFDRLKDAWLYIARQENAGIKAIHMKGPK